MRFKRMYWKHLAFFFSLSLTHPALAGSMGAPEAHKHSFATLTLGPEWIKPGHSQELSLLPSFINSYRANSSYKLAALFGLALGIERPINGRFYQLGLAGYINTTVRAKGDVWQFGLPEFNNFIYRYNVKSQRLLVTGKILQPLNQITYLYLSGELGSGFNKAYSYHETPVSETAVAPEPFKNRVKTSFAWGVGTGIDLDINYLLRLGIGYQFADLGKAKLFPSSAQLTNQSLSIAHLYSHQLRVQITALF